MEFLLGSATIGALTYLLMQYFEPVVDEEASIEARRQFASEGFDISHFGEFLDQQPPPSALSSPMEMQAYYYSMQKQRAEELAKQGFRGSDGSDINAALNDYRMADPVNHNY
jgi:hypothetical protein